VGALKLLGREELGAMLREDGQAELVCHFCSAIYRVPAEELQELIAEFDPA
jgi:molecular chaperone Hsp33